MSDRLTINLKNYPEYLAAARRVHGALANDKVRDILYEKGAKPVRSEQERFAPRGDTGDLKRALIAKPLLGGDFPVVITAVDFKKIRRQGTDKAANRYPYIVEHGSKPHIIKAKEGQVLAIRERNGGGEFATEVKHPGFKPLYFFRDGIRSARPKVKRDVQKALSQLVQQAANA